MGFCGEIFGVGDVLERGIGEEMFLLNGEEEGSKSGVEVRMTVGEENGSR